MLIQKISAITLTVSDMGRSLHFYRDVLGLKVLYGGETAYFSSLQTLAPNDAILNLETGSPGCHWGRVIFHVEDVDEFWAYLKTRGLDPPKPQDATWGERYFHLHDPDGHELSFAQPLK